MASIRRLSGTRFQEYLSHTVRIIGQGYDGPAVAGACRLRAECAVCERCLYQLFIGFTGAAQACLLGHIRPHAH